MPELPVDSPADLNTRFELLRPKICQTETEDSWEVIFKNLKALADLCQNGGACEFPTELLTIIRSISRPINNSLITERTRLSSVAVDLINALATGLGKSFKPLLQIFLPTLLSMCGRTNKVIVTRAKACIMIIVETTQLSAIISYFVQSIEDKSTSIRLAAAEGTLTCVNCFNPPDLEKDARASEIETIIRTAAKDAQADIRAIGRKLFEAYKVLLPKRVESFTGPLSPTTKKYLDIKSTVSVQLETSHAAAPHTKNQLSSSTSAISLLVGRTESAHVIHTRSASSSTLPIDGRVKPIMPSTKAATTTTLRQKTEMLPPAFIPVRLSTKTVSMTRSASATETRPRVVSTTLPLRAGETTKESHKPHSLPMRPNSATSHREMAQRLHLQPSAPTMSGPSGPRRVPISGAGSKVEETKVRLQAPVSRSRVVSNPNAASQSAAKVPITRAPQVPVREKPNMLIVKVRDARPPASSRAPTSTETSKPPKASGVTQPTLSQISRAKAAAEQKQARSNAPKARGGRTIVKEASSSTSNRHGAEKDRSKPKDTGVKKAVQPVTIPLPPSPTQSAEKCGSKLTDMEVEKLVQPATIPLPPSPTQSAEKGGSKLTETEVEKLVQPATISLPPSPTQSPEKCESKPTDTGVTRLVQPAMIPLPPSPTQSSPAEDGSELTHVPVMMLQAEMAATSSEPTQNEDSTPLVIRSPHDADDKVDTEGRAVQHDEENESSDQETTERLVEDHSGPLEGPTTPRVLSTDNIFDTNAKTPISSLLASIQRGFMFTPSSPLSPPQSYANHGKEMAIPFPLGMDGSRTEEHAKEGMKPFMFGIGEDYGRSTLGSVENLNLHK